MPQEHFEDIAVDVERYSPPKSSVPGTEDDPTPVEPSLEELEEELPIVIDGQVPLGDLLSRIVQAIYAELSEHAETLPNMSDNARKRTLADWVVKIKRQVVKLYAVAKWSRDAATIQKCMNITAFLLSQNQQFEDVITALAQGKDALDPARLRNHDLLTSLDVLTTGSYRRLPSCITKFIIPPKPLTDAEVKKTLSDMEETIRYRLRMTEIVPVEMSKYRIYDGRVHFTVPNLFKVSLCLKGKAQDSGWFFVDVEFLIQVGGDLTGTQEFPCIPTGLIKRHIADEADARLAFYLPLPEDQPPPPDAPSPPRLPEGVTDAPLVRAYNFLQMMSLSYQLEILWYQAERLRSLGWAEFLVVQMSPDRKVLKVSYWMRQLPPQPPGRLRPKVIPHAGTITITIIEAAGPPQVGSGPERTPKRRAIARIQKKSKLGESRPSDEVEGLKFSVTWEPTKGALGVNIPPEQSILPESILQVDANNLDFETTLRHVIHHHAKAILSAFQQQLQQGPIKVFSPPGVTSLVVLADGVSELRVQLCADEVIIITIDSRTGRLNLRDIGDLATAGRGPRFIDFSNKLNQNPTVLKELLYHLRITTILELAEQKANYLGLQSYRRRHIKNEELAKLGSDLKGTLYIQLAYFPTYYLVLIVTDERFKYALITTKVLQNTVFGETILEDVAWLDFKRIRKESSLSFEAKPVASADSSDAQAPESTPYEGFTLDTQALRELYTYCCARVAFMNVERQLKLRAIPFTTVNPSTKNPELSHLQSSLARSVPALCVQSKDILSNAPAADAAMPNIRIIPLNWWSDEKAKVVTCVKLKYVQQPMGKTAGGGTIIRPSPGIIYDTKEAVVSFLSEDVDQCVDEFLHEWSTVSRMVVIAREIAQMAKQKRWLGVRLLSFDLQTVEFAYAKDYTVSIACQDHLSPTGGKLELEFSRAQNPEAMDFDEPLDTYNPHIKAEPFFTEILRQGQERLAISIHRLVDVLRDTLPIVVELETIRRDVRKKGQYVEVFAKAAGWYRLLYNDLRHGLDFRLMKEQRVAIIDASASLFTLRNEPSHVSSTDSFSLQPLPDFADISRNAVREGLRSRTLEPGKVAAIDIGIVCSAAGVGPLTKAIHSQILERIQPP